MSRRLPTGQGGRALALALLAMLGIAVWQGAVAPMRDWYADRAEALSQRQVLAARMARIAAGLPELRRASTAEPARAAPAALLPGATDAVAGATLQQVVQDVAIRSGATLSSAEALAAEPSGTFRRISVRVTLAAQWPALLRLLDGLATSQPALLVDDVQLHARRIAGGGSIDASLTVSSFRAGAGG